jgi:hypothetical protein
MWSLLLLQLLQQLMTKVGMGPGNRPTIWRASFDRPAYDAARLPRPEGGDWVVLRDVVRVEHPQYAHIIDNKLMDSVSRQDERGCSCTGRGLCCVRCAVLSCAVLCCAVLCCAVLCCAVLWFDAICYLSPASCRLLTACQLKYEKIILDMNELRARSVAEVKQMAAGRGMMRGIDVYGYSFTRRYAGAERRGLGWCD